MRLLISLANDINSHIQTDSFSHEKVWGLANRLNEKWVGSVSHVITLSQQYDKQQALSKYYVSFTHQSEYKALEFFGACGMTLWNNKISLYF